MGRRRITERPDDPVIRSSARSGFQAPPGWTVRVMRGDRATKGYRCPGCEQEISAGVGHLVAVPDDNPELRRHWHRACWERFGP
jgi:hypothetical protein